MIRTKDKIFAETNDQNTVVASGTLMAGAPIVGAGNKGIKTLIPISSNGNLLYQDGEGKLKLLPLEKNKLIMVGDDLTLKLVDIL